MLVAGLFTGLCQSWPGNSPATAAIHWTHPLAIHSWYVFSLVIYSRKPLLDYFGDINLQFCPLWYFRAWHISCCVCLCQVLAFKRWNLRFLEARFAKNAGQGWLKHLPSEYFGFSATENGGGVGMDAISPGWYFEPIFQVSSSVTQQKKRG